jgi:sRNA-binding protein
MEAEQESTEARKESTEARKESTEARKEPTEAQGERKEKIQQQQHSEENSSESNCSGKRVGVALLGFLDLIVVTNVVVMELGNRHIEVTVRRFMLVDAQPGLNALLFLSA